MLYIFDTSSLTVLNAFYPDTFPTFWERFDQLVADGKVLSTREVLRELDKFSNRPNIQSWVKLHHEVFVVPTNDELRFVANIFEIPHFHNLIDKQALLKGTHVADPFVIAAARVKNGKVVTEETFKKNAAKIPNVCEHFNIPYTNVEGFLAEQRWSF